MADRKISDLGSVGTNISAQTEIPVTVGGTTYKVTIQAIRDFINDNIPFPVNSANLNNNIDARINALLGTGNDADTVVDRLSELVTLFQGIMENARLTQLFASKAEVDSRFQRVVARTINGQPVSKGQILFRDVITQTGDNNVNLIRGQHPISGTTPTGSDIGANTIGTSNIQNGAIANNKLAANSVSVSKIANNAVTNPKIANVASEKILPLVRTGTLSSEEPVRLRSTSFTSTATIQIYLVFTSSTLMNGNSSSAHIEYLFFIGDGTDFSSTDGGITVPTQRDGAFVKGDLFWLQNDTNRQAGYAVATRRTYRGVDLLNDPPPTIPNAVVDNHSLQRGPSISGNGTVVLLLAQFGSTQSPAGTSRRTPRDFYVQGNVRVGSTPFNNDANRSWWVGARTTTSSVFQATSPLITPTST